MLNELTFNLVAPLEQAGYTLPEKMVPDISEGRVFSQWLRDNRGLSRRHSQHITMSTQMAGHSRYVYTQTNIADFKQYFNEVWLPQYAPKYFAERDQRALTLIEKIMLPDLDS